MATDSGICCSFNSAFSLKDSTYSQLMRELRGEKKKGKLATVGRSKGLTVVVDQHMDLTTFGTVMSDNLAMEVFIGEPEESPMLRQRSITISPGMEHMVELDAISITAQDDVKNMAINDRGCLYRDEGELDWYSKYTFTTCLFECSIKRTEEMVGCVPWYLPQVPCTVLITTSGTQQHSLRPLGSHELHPGDGQGGESYQL